MFLVWKILQYIINTSASASALLRVHIIVFACSSSHPMNDHGQFLDVLWRVLFVSEAALVGVECGLYSGSDLPRSESDHPKICLGESN